MQMSDFAKHEVSPGANSVEVEERLGRDGLVIFRSWELGEILTIFRKVARVVPHRHST